MSEGELILYNTEYRGTAIGLRTVDRTVWPRQRGIAELFDKDVRIVIRKGNTGTTKNYLKDEEFVRVVVIYHDYAEDQSILRGPVTMAKWSDNLDVLLSWNERGTLTHAGRLQMDISQMLPVERLEVFDTHGQLEERAKVAAGRKAGGIDV